MCISCSHTFRAADTDCNPYTKTCSECLSVSFDDSDDEMMNGGKNDSGVSKPVDAVSKGGGVVDPVSAASESMFYHTLYFYSHICF